MDPKNSPERAVETNLFFGVSVADPQCPVVSPVSGRMTRTVCRDTRREPPVQDSVDRGYRVWTLSRNFWWGSLVWEYGRFVGRWVYDPESSSEYPTVTVYVWILPVVRYTGTGS